MIGTDLAELKAIFGTLSIFRRASIDFSIYYFAFRPKHSYVVTSKFGHLAHGSLRQWRCHSTSLGAIFMFGFVFVRADYRKFGIGELLTNYLLNLPTDEPNVVHTNVFAEHLPFYIRYGFQASFSLIGFKGKLSEFFDGSARKDETISVQSIESVDLLDLASYDARISPAYRIEYFEQLREHQFSVAGYVVLNFSQEFIKCGPLFAENCRVAEVLLRQCAIDYDGTMIFASPEENRCAMKFFESKLFQRTDVFHRVFRGNENIFSLSNSNSNIFQRVWSITDDWLSLI